MWGLPSSCLCCEQRSVSLFAADRGFLLCRVGGIYLDTGGAHRPASARNITKSQVMCWLTHLLPASAYHEPKDGAEDMHPCLHLPWENLRLAAVTHLSFQQSACTFQVSCVPTQEMMCH